MKKNSLHKHDRYSRRTSLPAILVICALSSCLENAFAGKTYNIDNEPKLIAQGSVEKNIKDKALREIAETTKQIKAGQSNWKIYYRRASALDALVRYEEALEDLEKAIKLDPNQVEPLLLHAKLSENTLDDEAAAKDYTAAIKLSPAMAPHFMVLRCRCYESMLRPDLALADALGYLKGHPERYNANLARIVGTLYLKLGKGKEAVEHFSYCLKSNPIMSSVHEMRGDAYMLLKKYNAAAADYSLEIARAPSIKTKLYVKRAAAYRKDGQLKKAAEDDVKIKSVSNEVFDIAPFRNKQ
ncbi:MAG: tetratricopeptide repeat protein [Candidatus Melainabacteria bacterium]|nr:tetratricopeptide repeat protein [Candidatus Melainabacteria bacterium]